MPVVSAVGTAVGSQFNDGVDRLATIESAMSEAARAAMASGISDPLAIRELIRIAAEEARSS